MTIIPQDYHIHTMFSCDCQATMVEMCRAALARNIQEIGFTDHIDMIPDDPCHGFFQADEWWAELERCRKLFSGMLRIRAGAEVGEPHRFSDELHPLLDSYPWDYILGSLHWVGPWCVFEDEYFEQTLNDAYRAYFQELSTMVAEGDFDVLAHMDVVKRLGDKHYKQYDYRAYENEIRAVLQTCAARGIALEVNCSTLRHPMKELSPNAKVIQWFLEEGGQWVTLGSDAHHVKQIQVAFETGLEAIHRAGFDHLARFQARTPEPLPLLNPET